MTLNIGKGRSLSLSKLRIVRFAMAWSPAPNDREPPRDGEITAVPLIGDSASARKVLGTDWVACHAQLTTPDDLLTHSGDSLEGKGEGDDESIIVNLSKMPASVVEIPFLATIHDAARRISTFPDGSRKPQDWELLDATATLYNHETNEVIAVYPLGRDYAGMTAVQVVSMFRDGEKWTYQALGAGSTSTLLQYLKAWGADVTE